MSQADYTIADQDGASFLVDINNQLAAIVSNNSGATEPATKYAYQWWADTSSGLLKIRNAANSAWVTIGTLGSANLGLLALSGGTLTGALNEAQGADIASAGTVNLTTATGNYVHITGTTTITAITLAQGATRTVVFDGALTLTNGASLLLPTAANITTAAGDTAVFRGEASSVVRCVSYVRKDGTAIAGSALSYLSGAEYNTGTDTIKILNAAVARANNLVQGSRTGASSNTSFDYTGIPSWVKRITLMLDNISTSGTSGLLFQLGDSGGIENTGYVAGSTRGGGAAVASASYTTGFGVAIQNAADTYNGFIVFTYLGANIWCANGLFGYTTLNFTFNAAGSKTLSDTLTRVRLTNVNGIDTFDSGSINIIYE